MLYRSNYTLAFPVGDTEEAGRLWYNLNTPDVTYIKYIKKMALGLIRKSKQHFGTYLYDAFF
jgi:hypothetical protein